jgi:hypothetical protein
MSRILDVVIVSNSGCRNSRYIPRPTKATFNIDPPQLEPWIETRVGSGQNTGCPEM